MLPPSILIMSMVIFLTTTVSMAPVEEKEQEEVEVEAIEEGEGELSEEEEDEDESKSQDKIDDGLVGVQRTTTVAAAAASGGSGVWFNGREVSAFGGGQVSGGPTGDGTAGSSAAQGPDSSLGISAGSPVAAGELSVAHTHLTGSDGADSESHANGQKLLNGGGGGRGHMTPPPLPDTVISSGVTVAPPAHPGGSGPDSPAVLHSVEDLHHHFVISIHQSGQDHMLLSSGPDQSLSSSVSGSSHSVAQRDGVDYPDNNGSGRQTLVMDTNAVTSRLVSSDHLQNDFTASGLSHDVTETPHAVMNTEANHYTHTTGGSAHAVLTGTDSVSAGTGSPLDYSHPTVTDHTHTAGSVTEQYNPSGAGPEGAENVELEDTC